MTTLYNAGSEFALPRRSAGRMNVGHAERIVSVLGGAALAAYGLKRRSLVGAGLALLGGGLVHRGYTGHCLAYSAMRVSTSRREPASPDEFFERGIHVQESVRIDRSPWDLYEFWRNFENLPRFMTHLKSVKTTGRRSHWVAEAPAGMTVEWDAEIINDEPTALIAWRSLGNTWVDHAGSVRFIPGAEGAGTEVKVTLDYIPPGGELGRGIARLFGEEPGQQISADLQRFKQMMEPAPAESAPAAVSAGPTPA